FGRFFARWTANSPAPVVAILRKILRAMAPDRTFAAAGTHCLPLKPEILPKIRQNAVTREYVTAAPPCRQRFFRRIVETAVLEARRRRRPTLRRAPRPGAQSSPCCSSHASTSPADSSGVRPAVSNVSSGATGGSYGSETPVNSGISPERAFAYNPFTS